MSNFEQVDIVPPPPPRPTDSHKGTFGTVIVVGGAPTMIGAPALCASGALRGRDIYGRTVLYTHGSKSNPSYNYLYVDGHVSVHQPADTVGDVDVNSAQPRGFWTRSPND